MSDNDPLAVCCRLLAESQHIIEAKNAEIELLRGYRDEAESQAAIAALAADRLRLTDAEREAVALMAEVAADPRGVAVYAGYEVAATLRGLLERAEGTQ